MSFRAIGLPLRITDGPCEPRWPHCVGGSERRLFPHLDADTAHMRERCNSRNCIRRERCDVGLIRGQDMCRLLRLILLTVLLLCLQSCTEAAGDKTENVGLDRISISPTVAQLGKRPIGSIATTRFFIRNLAAKNVVIGPFSWPCSCQSLEVKMSGRRQVLVSGVSTFAIGPAATAELCVRIDVIAGAVDASIRMLSLGQTLRIRLLGVEAYRREPPKHDLGVVKAGSRRRLQFSFSRIDQKKWFPTGIRINGKATSNITVNGDRKGSVKKGFELLCIAPNEPGPFTLDCQIETSLGDTAVHTVTGEVRASFRVNPVVVSFGKVLQLQKVTRSFIVREWGAPLSRLDHSAAYISPDAFAGRAAISSRMTSAGNRFDIELTLPTAVRYAVFAVCIPVVGSDEMVRVPCIIRG